MRAIVITPEGMADAEEAASRLACGGRINGYEEALIVASGFFEMVPADAEGAKVQEDLRNYFVARGWPV